MPAGTHILSWATISFVCNSLPFTLVSDTAELVVAQVAGADLEPPRVTNAASEPTSCSSRCLPTLATALTRSRRGASARGWSITIYRDVNEDGQINGADAPLLGPVSLGICRPRRAIAQVVGTQ